MMGGGGEARKTLADIILEKIQDKEEQQQRMKSGAEDVEEEDVLPEMPPKVVEVSHDRLFHFFFNISL
jgi:urease gamma subunit